MKKGFTLVELLAVIVILAVIALIATPTILNMIEKSRKGAAESSMLNYVDQLEKQIVTDSMSAVKYIDYEGKYTVSGNTVTKTTDSSVKFDLDIKGDQPDKNAIDSSIEITEGEVTFAQLRFGKYYVTYSVIDNKSYYCSSKDGFSMECAQYPNGYAVYFNPETGEKCDSSSSVSSNGTKTGCMKWYVYGDTKESDKVNMILDHNTTPLVAWNSSGSNETGMKEIKTALESDISTWLDSIKITARLITVEEINDIIGNTAWSKNPTWFYLDNSGQTQIATVKGQSKYAWLYDYTASCIENGCNIEDNNKYSYDSTKPTELVTGYWTSTTQGTTNAYLVQYVGNVSYGNVKGAGSRGVRPVITVEKSLLN